MALKDWLRSKQGGGAEASYTIDDLIVMGKLAEAESRLKLKLAGASHDLHARRKLADVLVAAGRGGDAVDEYQRVVDGYTRDGFYDKAHAVLRKISRLVPDRQRIEAKMAALERAKSLDRKRDLVIEAILAGDSDRRGLSAFEIRAVWWKLTASPLFDSLRDDQLQRLFTAMRFESLPPAGRLARRGDERPELVMIADGEIEAFITRGESTLVLRSFGPGDIVGERVLLEHQPWPSHYRAGPASKVLRLDRDGLERAMTGDENPRALLEALRAQRHDREVAKAVAEIKDT